MSKSKKTLSVIAATVVAITSVLAAAPANAAYFNSCTFHPTSLNATHVGTNNQNCAGQGTQAVIMRINTVNGGIHTFRSGWVAPGRFTFVTSSNYSLYRKANAVKAETTLYYF